MNYMYYFRHMESSDALKFEIEQKLAGLESLLQPSTPIHVTFDLVNGFYTVHVGLHARDNSHVQVDVKSDDMYKSIDQAYEAIRRQVTRVKEKQVQHHVKDDPFVSTEQAANAVTHQLNDDEAVDAEYVIAAHQLNYD